MPERPLAGQPFAYLQRSAEQWPDRTFFDDGTHAMPNAQALVTATQIAGKLRELGVRTGDTVALDLPLGLQLLFIEACFHLAAVSCRPPALPTGQPGFVADWECSSTKAASTQARRSVIVDATFLRDLASQPTDLAPTPYPSLQSPCRIHFSSGTTGDPKALAFSLEMVHERALAAQALAIPGTAFMCLLDMGSASGFHTFYASVMHGETYLIPEHAAHNVAQIRRHKVTSIKASPMQIAGLVRELQRSGVSVPSLRSIYSAGTVLPLPVKQMVRRLTGARLYNLYGSTEAGRGAERDLDDDHDPMFAGSVAEGTTLQVVDEHDVEAPFGTVGFIRYRRPFQATEYVGDAEATARAFRDGWFYTGDSGSVTADGKVTLAGRVSELINAGGLKIDPVGVESFAVELDGIRDAAGFAFLDDIGMVQFGLAVVQDEAFAQVRVMRELRTAFGFSSPSVLFPVYEIPRNAMGKPLRREIAQQYRAANQ